MSSIHISRRQFAAGSLATLLPTIGSSQQPVLHPLKGRIKKTLKLGMIRVGTTLEEKFAAAKQAGFDGVEVHAPGFDVEEAKAAIKATGLPIDGSVCSGHWKIRHTDPDESVRQEALKTLKAALRDTKAVGGDTVLLVVGHGKDGTEKEVWDRSITNIKEALPLAEELDMMIAIENVWNHIGYDHAGPSDQTAEKLAQYCDRFESDQIAMQFDIGNHWKYGATGDWIRHLDQRVYKLDIKGFSRKRNKFTKVGEGDLDWTDVRKALIEIDYHGWCAAEVGGGDLNRLKEVAANMDRELGLG